MSKTSQRGQIDPATYAMLERFASTNAQAQCNGRATPTLIARKLVQLVCGHELGLSMMASLTGFYYDDKGKLVCGGNLLASLIQRSEHYDYRIIARSDRGCTLEFSRDGEPLSPQVTYGIDEATRAGLITTPYYQRHPEAMFFNRAMSAGYKLHCPSVTGGMTLYVEGETQPDAEPNDTLLAIDRADVARIKRAAHAAGLDALALYNIIRQAAGGEPRHALEDPAGLLERQWPHMPQALAAPVLAAIAEHTGPDEQSMPGQEATTAATAPNAPPSAPPAQASSTSAVSEALATAGDVTRILALAAETQTSDSDLLDLVRTTCGRPPAAHGAQAARRLPGELQRLPLRLVPGLIACLRQRHPQGASEGVAEPQGDAGAVMAGVIEPHGERGERGERGEDGHAPLAA